MSGHCITAGGGALSVKGVSLKRKGRAGIGEVWWGPEGRAWDPPPCVTGMTALEAGPEDGKGRETGWEGTTVHLPEI